MAKAKKEKIGLNEMVVALRKELLEAQQEAARQDLKFKIEEIELELELVTTKEGEGGGFVNFWVYNAGVHAKLAKAHTHRLLLKLKPETEGGDTRISDRDTK